MWGTDFNTYILLLAECPFLRVEERWLLLCQAFPSLADRLDFYWLDRVRLKKDKLARFNYFVDTIDLAQLRASYSENSQCISYFDQAYPNQLRYIYAPPLVLYYQGNLELLAKQSLAVVGPRNHSNYSSEVLKRFMPKLVQKDLVIISGLAKGVDSLAHRLTIEHRGQTIGVIGSGLDYFYPKENKGLQNYMARNHLVLSEYPPGLGPDKTHFPMRNRIIAGISRGLLITEARKRSGTLITARIALEEGRDIFVIPGPITHPLSEGCNDLISQGALAIQGPEDIFLEWGIK